MDDRITEVREAHRIVMKSIDNEWTLDDEAQHGSVKVLADAAQAWVDLLDSDALIIRRDDAAFVDQLAFVLNSHLDRLQAFSNLETDLPIRFAATAVYTMVENAHALASSQGVEP